jgi:ATP-dependent protease ClpP protease subunit
MKKILAILMLIMSLSAYSSESVKLEKGNFFAITSQFNGNLLSDFSEKVLNYDGDKMYIYFDTPGGSVIALSRMARIMKASDIEFTCITNFAASAGFMLFQHCNKRLMLSDGVLMSHNWSGGFRDEAPRILTLFYTIQNLVNTLEQVAVNNMNVDAKEYARLINNNLWMTANEAIAYNAAEGVVDKISCSKEILKQRIPIKVVAFSFFGITQKTYYKSGCPLISKLYEKVPKSTDEDGYLQVNADLFTNAQQTYKMGDANWIYLGDRRN